MTKTTELTMTDVINHNDFSLALRSFLDKFKYYDNRQDMITNPPKSDNADKLNLCILAAVAHKLANDYGIPVPEWVNEYQYRMPEPVFAFNTENREYQEFLLKDTPYEFAGKNIYYGADTLERA